MKKLWSKKWVASSQKRKQRKYIYNAPHHIRQKFLSVHLSSGLRKIYPNLRNLKVRKGDTVKICAGQFKGKLGKVERVSLIKSKVFVSGAVIKRADASEVLYPIHPSNLELVSLNLKDKLREKRLSKFKAKGVKNE